MSLIPLLLLADSRLPAGTHAHSGGLEAAVRAGRVHDGDVATSSPVARTIGPAAEKRMPTDLARTRAPTAHRANVAVSVFTASQTGHPLVECGIAGIALNDWVGRKRIHRKSARH